MLISLAYSDRLPGLRVAGGPDWLTDRFDIVGKAPTDTASTEDLRLMLRALLVDRFKLAVHTETQAVPIYALRVMSSDGSLGAHLRHSVVTCGAPRVGIPEPGEQSPCGILPGMAFGRIRARGVGMEGLARFLSQDAGRQAAGRVVVDKTGLRGRFDADLTWTPTELPRGIERPRDVPAPNPNVLSIFTAVQEQLGLRLESTQGSVDLVMIDHVEKPSPS